MVGGICAAIAGKIITIIKRNSIAGGNFQRCQVVLLEIVKAEALCGVITFTERNSLASVIDVDIESGGGSALTFVFFDAPLLSVAAVVIIDFELLPQSGR